MDGEHAHDGGDADRQTPAGNKMAGGACFFCVICVGAMDVSPSAAAPRMQHLTVAPVAGPALADLSPEPGVRPPLA